MIEVRYQGQLYSLFKDMEVSTSVEDLVGTFTFSTALNQKIPFDIDDKIELVIDGRTVITGFIEKKAGDISDEASTVSFGGRDILGDLIDSSVPDFVSVNQKEISLVSLCDKTLKALKIKSSVKNLAGNLDNFSKSEVEAVGFGGKAGEFLQSFARKRGVFLNTDGLGNLIIFSPPSRLENDEKFTSDNMKNRSFSLDNSNRYNVVKVGSQSNNSIADADLDNLSGSSSITESFVDQDIRNTRYLEINAEESMNSKELLQRAKEEVNTRRARAFSFSFDVPSHRYRIGKLIRVEDPESKVFGNFLIKNVVYRQGVESGNTSTLTITYPESYSFTGKRTSARKSVINKKESEFSTFNLPNERLLT